MIRIGRTKDLRVIQKLDLELIGDALSAEQLTASTWWLARVDGDVAGYCGVRVSQSLPGSVYLIRAGVLERFRGQGLQRRMIQTRLRWGKAQGHNRAITETRSGNVPSMRNLVKAGFLPFEPVEKWGWSDAVYWTRSLK